MQAKERSSGLRGSFTLLTWYWLLLSIAAVGLPWALPRLSLCGVLGVQADKLLQYHSLCVYIAAFGGFVAFILSLKKASLRIQFSQLGITFVVLIFVVFQSLIQIANIYSGFVWFVLPTSLVIVNDIAAYLCGTAFGKTQLIRLSPKKTLEGYLAAAVITLLWAWGCSRQLQRLSSFICPQPFIFFTPFTPLTNLSCTPSSVFVSTCADIYFTDYYNAWEAAAPAASPALEAEQAAAAAPAAAAAATPAAALLPPGNHQQQQQQLQLLQQHYQDQQRKRSFQLQMQQQQQLHQQQLALLKQHENLTFQAAATQQKILQLQHQHQHHHQQQQQQEQQEEEHDDEDSVSEAVASLAQHREGLLQQLQQVEAGLKSLEQQQRSTCSSVVFSPFDLHALVLGSFAAFFAPFGGFFASGFKRALRIKVNKYTNLLLAS